jgi:hypothetical protein
MFLGEADSPAWGGKYFGAGAGIVRKCNENKKGLTNGVAKRYNVNDLVWDRSTEGLTQIAKGQPHEDCDG